MNTMKEVLSAVALAAVAMFVPVSAAITGHTVVAFLSIPLVVVYLSIGADLFTDYSIKHWKE